MEPVFPMAFGGCIAEAGFDCIIDFPDIPRVLDGAEVARGRVMAGHRLAMDPGDVMGTIAGIPTTEPAFGLPAIWVAEDQRAEAEALGYTVVDGESVIVTHLTETIRRYAAQLLTRQDVRQLLDQLKESNEAVVTEVVRSEEHT